MNGFEAFNAYENFYDLYMPIKEKSTECFAFFSDVPHFLFNAVTRLSYKNDVASKVDSLILQVPNHNRISFWLHAQNEAENLEEILKERNFQRVITY